MEIGDLRAFDASEDRTSANRAVAARLEPGFIEKTDFAPGRGPGIGCRLVRLAVFAEEALHGLSNFFGRERLGDIVRGSKPHRGGGVGNARIAGHEDHRHVGLLRAEALEELDAVKCGHLDVEEDGLVIALHGQVESPARIAALFDLEALAHEDAAAAFADHFFIVHDQQAGIVQHDSVPVRMSD